MFASHASLSLAPAMSPYYDHQDSSDDMSDSYSSISGSVSQFAPSSATSDTSHDWEMRSASPTPSIYSLTSSLRAAVYKEEFGRGLNNYSDVYQLPADDEELARLDHQHEMFKMVMGKYPPPLDGILQDDDPEVVKSVVDLGCGSGSWILQVARDYPHVSAVAIDLVPMQSLNMPPNCRSEVDDINLGLQHYYGDFNVVHARLICTGIKDYAGLVDQMALTLRPGGLIHLTEYNFVIHDQNKRPILVDKHNLEDPEGPWLPRWMALAQHAIRTRGGTVDAAKYMGDWVRNTGAFRDIVHHDYWFQASPWNTGGDSAAHRENDIARTMREDMLAFLGSGRPLLLGSGIPEHLVNEIEHKARRELMEARTPLYILIQSVYAQKV